MKRKGFTLVELLAVIVILSVIAIITVPIIGNVIEESRKKALEQSAYGIIEAANYLALKSNQLEHFTFTSDGVESITENKLDYKGKIDATGDLYIDEEGDISLCLSNDKYYVYKNYGMNDEVIVGEKKDGNCIAGHDILTNKYVAMLDNGTGQVSNVYSKDEVNKLIADLSNTYATKQEVIESVNELNEKINMRYNSTTDTVEIFYNNTWNVWKYGNMQVQSSLNTSNMLASDWEDYDNSGAIWTKSSSNQFQITNGGANTKKSVITKNIYRFDVGTVFHFTSNLGANNPYSSIRIFDVDDGTVTDIGAGTSNPVIPATLANKNVKVIIIAGAAGTSFSNHTFSLYTS